MKKEKLTKKFIDGITEKSGMIKDSEYPSLILRISGNTKTFCFLKTYNYKQFLKAIGNANNIRRDEALKVCAEWTANLGKFGDINPEKTKKKNIKSITLGEVLKIYRQQRPKNSPGVPWNNHCIPFDNRTIDSLSRTELTELHASISKNAPVQANRTISAIRAVINFAIKENLWQGVNVAALIKLSSEASRQRFLTPEEAPKVIEALNKMREDPRHKDGADALLLMLYTWQRGGNVLAMEWGEIDAMNIWTIPAEKAKSRKNIVVALTEEALEIINDRERNGKYVFPMRGNPSRHYSDCKKTWIYLRKICGLKDCHKHDLRHTGATYALRSGADITTVSAALGHASVSFTAKVYAHVMTESKLDAARGAIDAMKNGGKVD